MACLEELATENVAITPAVRAAYTTSASETLAWVDQTFQSVPSPAIAEVGPQPLHEMLARDDQTFQSEPGQPATEYRCLSTFPAITAFQAILAEAVQERNSSNFREGAISVERQEQQARATEAMLDELAAEHAIAPAFRMALLKAAYALKAFQSETSRAIAEAEPSLQQACVPQPAADTRSDE